MTTDWLDVYSFWFGKPGTPEHGEVQAFWFGGGSDIDDTITQRFSATYDDAVAGKLDSWAEEAKSAVSLVLALDQFPRNMFRGEARSFAFDHLALENAMRLVDSPLHDELTTVEKLFAYLPFEHSENIDHQDRCVALFNAIEMHEHKDEWIEFAVEHRDIVQRFGRFPHRNAILGRDNTREEEIWLRESDQRFGTVVEEASEK